MKKLFSFLIAVVILGGLYLAITQHSPAQRVTATIPFQHPKNMSPAEQSTEPPPMPTSAEQFPHVNVARLKDLESKPYHGPEYKVNYEQERLARKAVPMETRLPASKTNTHEDAE